MLRRAGCLEHLVKNPVQGSTEALESSVILVMLWRCDTLFDPVLIYLHLGGIGDYYRTSVRDEWFW